MFYFSFYTLAHIEKIIYQKDPINDDGQKLASKCGDNMKYVNSTYTLDINGVKGRKKIYYLCLCSYMDCVDNKRIYEMKIIEKGVHLNDLQLENYNRRRQSRRCREQIQ